MGSWEEHVR
jgi:hypothetical protein